MENLNFGLNESQTYECHNQIRTVVYSGRCESCGIRTYSDGYNDPRGPLGEHTNYNLIAEEYKMQGPTVIACFNCMNDSQRYHGLRVIAERRWRTYEKSNMVNPDIK